MQSTKGRKRTGRKQITGEGYAIRHYPHPPIGRSGWWGHHKVRKQVKDRLFRFLFEKDKEALLELYNALNGTAYQDIAGLKVVTIENVVYVVMKNDLAFVIAGTLNLYEHQSTYNPNMPVRFLIYLAEEYQKLLKQARGSIYGTRQLNLPTPQCIVFYNGGREMPEEQILKLSDAFENRKVKGCIELKVRMLNINHGKNQALMEKCRILEEYSMFVERARQYLAEGREHQEALNLAIDYCIDHDILSVFLKRYRAEVLGMLLEEIDMDAYERTIREEAREDGIEEGIKEGMEQGADRAAELVGMLLDFNRMEDLKRMTTDRRYREKLFQELGLK